MRHVVSGPDQGFLLSLATLRFALDRLTEGPRAWWIKEADFDSTSEKVLVRQRDDDYMQRLNDIGFFVPVVARNLATHSEESVIVGLHAGNLDAEEHGLYISRQGLLKDFISDFEAFWTPLAELLEVYAEDTQSDLAASFQQGGA